MSQLRKRIASVFLCAAILVSGCQNRETTKEEEDLSSEQITMTSTDSEETVASSDSENSDPSDGSMMPDYANPQDSILKTIVADLMNNTSLTSNDKIMVLCDNGEYKVDNIISALMTFTALSSEYEFSEECYAYRKENVNTYKGLTLDQYRDKVKEYMSDAEFKKNFDDDYHLKNRPETRVLVTIDSALGDFVKDKDLLLECLKKGFALYGSDPELKEMIDLSIGSEPVNGKMVQNMGLILQFDSQQNIRVRAGVYTYAHKEIYKEVIVPSNLDKVENVLQGSAKIEVKNVFLNQYSSESFTMEKTGSAAEALLKRLEDAREKGSISDDASQEIKDRNKAVTIVFEDTYQSRYSYEGNGIWLYQSGAFRMHDFFRIDDEKENERLLDELCMEAGLPILSEKNGGKTMNADFSKIYDQPALADTYPQGNTQLVWYYVNPETDWYYMRCIEDDATYYQERMSRTYQADDGQNVPENWDEYEYAGVPGEMYYRIDMKDVFMQAEKFEGFGSLDYLLKEKEDPYTFCYGLDVINGTQTLRCDIYRNSVKRLAVILDQNGVPTCGWTWREEGVVQERGQTKFNLCSGLGIIEAIQMNDWNPAIDEYLEHARDHMIYPGDQDPNGRGNTGNGNSNKSAADWIRYDQKQEGLPDLTDKIVKGDSIDHSDAVQHYLDYLAQGKPYTMILSYFGAFMSYHDMLTVRDMDFYHTIQMQSHDNAGDMDFLYLALGDNIYMGSIEDPQVYPKGDSFSIAEVQMQLPDALSPAKEHTFLRAYEAKVDNTDFVIEEWSVEGETVIFYCMDGAIIGFRANVNGFTMIYHLLWFEEKADESLLKEPD